MVVAVNSKLIYTGTMIILIMMMYEQKKHGGKNVLRGN